MADSSSDVTGNKVIKSLTFSYQLSVTILLNEHYRRQESSVVLHPLGERISPTVEQGQDLSGLDVFRQKSMIRKAAVGFVVEVDVAAVA